MDLTEMGMKTKAHSFFRSFMGLAIYIKDWHRGKRREGLSKSPVGILVFFPQFQVLSRSQMLWQSSQPSALVPVKGVTALTCHGIFSGSVFSFSSMVSGIVASGLIVCFPFFEADHFSRWSWGTCYIKKRESFFLLSVCLTFYIISSPHK